ncbi:hypothetical protein HW932_21070 [Allochromatium humboldtianum]|uniref:Uncharacterized protein n=1 Tax=Allochromatium humboldtianum TaxID=504901 RepID=A0A850RKV9_9GAMM|nr:hypothetical protein [Allochromatium humboldtianum]NVZ11742.1 hypothetical protein [Allochromatium humboldtianum]
MSIDPTLTQSLQEAIEIIRHGRALERMLIEAGFSLADTGVESRPTPNLDAASRPAAANARTNREPEPPAPEWPQAHPQTGELVDATGCPWIESAHSAKKTCTENGAWRRKRRANPRTVADLEREAREAMRTETSAQETSEPTTPDVTLYQVLSAIDAAETTEDLAQAAELIESLSGDEKAQAETECRERQAAIERLMGTTTNGAGADGQSSDADSEPTDFERIREGMAASLSEDELNGWDGESRLVLIPASQREKLDWVYEQRLRQLTGGAPSAA